jgi:hypothetical protein
MVWIYWAEARPYALWFFLSTVQLLLYLRFASTKKELYLNWLTVVHLLLALTVVISAGQVAIVTLLVWVSNDRKFTQQMLFMSLPIVLCVYFAWVALHSGMIHHYTVNVPFGLIHQAFALDRLLLLGLLGAIYTITSRWIKTFRISGELISYGVLSFLFAFALLGYFKYREFGNWPYKDYLDSRYFIFLVPVAIVAVTWFSVHLYKMIRQSFHWLWSVQLIVLISFFFVIRCLLLYQDLYKTALLAY